MSIISMGTKIVNLRRAVGSGTGGGGGFTNTKSLDFDGVDDYLDLGTESTVADGGQFTLSFWIKGAAAALLGFTYLFSADYYNLHTFWCLQGSNMRWVNINNISNNLSVGVLDNNWHHILIIWNPDGANQTIRCFTDGANEVNVSTDWRYGSGGIYNGALQYIGNRGGGTFTGFNGGIDEFAVWNDDQSANVSTIYNGGTPTDLTSLSPNVWYRMGENSTFKSPQILMPENSNKDKVSNYSFQFDGVDDKVELGTQSLGITGAISVSAWVKIPTTNTGGAAPYIQYIVCEDRTFGTSRNWALFWRGGTHLNGFSAFIYDSSGVYTPVNSATPTPNDNQWHHLMFTYTGDTSTDGLKLFVDGVQIAQATSSNGGLRSTTAVVPTIGGISQTITWMFEGNIDEVSIFNTDQSTNVSTIYNDGIPNDLTPLSPLHWYRMGEEATFSTNWTVPDQVGSNNGTSANMTIEDRVGDAPNSSNNSLSYNMDAADIVEDTPPN